MRLRSEVIGALNVFRMAPGPLTEADMKLARALADVATVGILQHRVFKAREMLAEQLQEALDSRVLIEQAKGVLAERSGQRGRGVRADALARPRAGAVVAAGWPATSSGAPGCRCERLPGDPGAPAVRPLASTLRGRVATVLTAPDPANSPRGDSAMTDGLLSQPGADERALLDVRVTATATGWTAVTVTGEVDVAGAPVLRRALEAVWADAPHRVVIDLGAVTFLNAAGLHVLLETRRTAQERSTSLRLCAAAGQVRQLLDWVGLGDLMRCAAEEPPAAVQSPPRRWGESAIVPGRGVETASRPADVGRARLVAVPDVVPVPQPAEDRSPDDVLAAAIRWTRRWDAMADLDGTLAAIEEDAVDALPGAEGACVALAVRRRQLLFRSDTGSRPRTFMAVQQLLGSGPSWDVAWQDGAVVVHDLAADRQWPALSAEAGDLGMRSVLGLHLGTPGQSIGSLTVYSAQPGAFDEATERLGRTYAALAAVALARAQREHHLRRAVCSRDRIGQAKGILMERHHVTAEQAFETLIEVSRECNVKLVTLAERLIARDS
jgi:anti-anti-sigma factor